MDAIEQLGTLFKAAPPFPPKKKKGDGDEKGDDDCPTGDKDDDGTPNSLDAAPDDPSDGADDADDGAVSEEGGEEAAIDAEMPEDEDGGGFAPEEEMAGAGGADAATVDLVEQLAAAEKDFYAAKGMHGTDHHKAELAMETFHKLVRKLAKQVHPGVGKGVPPVEENGDASGVPNGGDGGGGSGGAFGAQGGAASEGEQEGGDEGPPDEVIEEAKKAGMGVPAINELIKSWMAAKQSMLEPTVDEEMRGKMEPDWSNFSGDPNGGEFINWGTSSLVGRMQEAGPRGEPSGVTGDSPYTGSGAGEAHPHYGQDAGFGKPPPGPPFGAKMGEAPMPPWSAKNKPDTPRRAEGSYHTTPTRTTFKEHRTGGSTTVRRGSDRGHEATSAVQDYNRVSPTSRSTGLVNPQRRSSTATSVMRARMSDEPTGMEYAALGAAMRGPNPTARIVKRTNESGTRVVKNPGAGGTRTATERGVPGRSGVVSTSGFMRGKMSVEPAAGLDYAYLGAMVGKLEVPDSVRGATPSPGGRASRVEGAVRAAQRSLGWGRTAGHGTTRPRTETGRRQLDPGSLPKETSGRPKAPTVGRMSAEPQGHEYAALGAAMRGKFEVRGPKRVSQSQRYPLTGKPPRERGY